MQDNLARKLPQEQVRVQRRPRVQAKPQKHKIRWSAVFAALTIFVMSMVLVTRYARVAELEREVIIAKSRLEKIESSNISRRVRLKQETDMENVEKIATEKLGMVKPGKNQIIHINIPVEDNVMYNAEEGNEFFLKEIIDGIGKIVAYLH